MRHLAALPLIAPFLVSCTGHVIMTPISPERLSKDYASARDVDGIIVFRPKPLVEVDKLTQAIDPKSGKVTDYCKRVPSRKLITVADWQHPYRLHYEHGLLETYTFGATMTIDGILITINSQSTPDQGKTLANLASAASAAATARKAPEQAAATTRPDCTQSPVFVDYEAPPNDSQVAPYGKTRIGP